MVMGTLGSELGPHAGRISGQPRLYVDANVPAGLVAFMRTRLRWDVLFVLEHDDLRRARDGEHYRSPPRALLAWRGVSPPPRAAASSCSPHPPNTASSAC